MDPEEMKRADPATYWAITMEITRSIFVNWSVEQRQQRRRRVVLVGGVDDEKEGGKR